MSEYDISSIKSTVERINSKVSGLQEGLAAANIQISSVKEQTFELIIKQKLLHDKVDFVSDKVDFVSNELLDFKKIFGEYIENDRKQKNVILAETRFGNLKQAICKIWVLR